jgi:hypothetical protein
LADQFGSYSDLEVLAKCPSNCEPSQFFNRYNQAFVPPYFAFSAQEISNKSHVDFVQLWAWETERLIYSLNLSKSVEEVSSYIRGDGPNGNMPGASSAISEIFKSAFIRCVAWFYLQGFMLKEMFVDYSTKVLPIDLSLWEIGTGVVPDWWPRSGPSSSDLFTFSEWDQCLHVPDIDVEGRQVIAAEGAVVPTRKLTRAHFSVLPFGYRIRGPLGEISDTVHRRLQRSAWAQNPLEPNIITMFDGPTLRGWIPLHHSSSTVDTVEVYPLVAGVRALNINAWQSWRIVHQPFFPSLHLCSQYGTVGHDQMSWFYNVRTERVFEGHDWQIGPLERSHQGEFELTGQYALCERTWLRSFLEEQNLRLAHVVRISVLQRKYGYEDPKDLDSCRFINLSPVIT